MFDHNKNTEFTEVTGDQLKGLNLAISNADFQQFLELKNAGIVLNVYQNNAKAPDHAIAYIQRGISMMGPIFDWVVISKGQNLFEDLKKNPKTLEADDEDILGLHIFHYKSLDDLKESIQALKEVSVQGIQDIKDPGMDRDFQNF